MIVNSSKNKRGRRGQALVEFSLALTILLFLIFGILEFGRVLFAYSSASDSLRSALRNATVLGVEEGSSMRPYLDCNDMQAVAQNNFFTGTQTITIRYQKTDGSGLFYSCNGVGDPQVSDSVLNNGDLLVIDLDTTVSPLWFRFVDTLNINLRGQRTIIKLIVPGAGPGDEDFDGLLDDWEIANFGDIESNGATDDPDGDLCNNGCEEEAGTDPNNGDLFPEGIGSDPDGDGIETTGIPADNCPTVPNTDQLDENPLNGIGDACEDADGDGTLNAYDTCPGTPDLGVDSDGDGIDNACDPDIDNDDVANATDNCDFYFDPSNACLDTDLDGLYDGEDNCIGVPNPDQADFVQPGNEFGDACEDPDGDLINNDVDNCPFTSNPPYPQADSDGDGIGDACEDSDEDGVFDSEDNCPTVYNPAPQADSDGNGIGDACEGDEDEDGVPDYSDNCINDKNPNQEDYDRDQIGDACDPDADNDGEPNATDNCPLKENPDQQNADQALGDTLGDECDDDDDNDGEPDVTDNCQFDANPGQENYDEAGGGDACDPDDDNDGIDDDVPDNCPFGANPLQEDADKDGIGDLCDPTPNPNASISGVLRGTNNVQCTSFTSTFYGGAPLAVIITHVGTGATQQATPNATTGAFSFPNLPDGNYTIDPPTISGVALTAEQASAGGCLSPVVDPVNVTLTNGAAYTITFGYK